MLKNIELDKKPNGKTIFIPVEITASTIQQQIKIIIEWADYSTFDVHCHLSRFRSFHGGDAIIQILQGAIDELETPTIELDIRHDPRKSLQPFFEGELALHKTMNDAYVGYLKDRSCLPI